MKVIAKNDEAVSACVKMLCEEKVLVLPTDTVYGFSGIVDKTEKKIRAIKGRGDDKPFIMLIAKPEDVYTVTSMAIPHSLFSLWPGALTIIVPNKANTATVALRCPGDEWLRSVIEKCGMPIYSTSVNRSGNPILGTVKEICREFGDEVELIVDNGDCVNSSASTIVQIKENGISLIRQGSVLIPSEFLK